MVVERCVTRLMSFSAHVMDPKQKGAEGTRLHEKHTKGWGGGVYPISERRSRAEREKRRKREARAGCIVASV